MPRTRPRLLQAFLTAVLVAVSGIGLTATATAASAAATGGFIVSKAEYNRMFPQHKGFYTYASLVKAMRAYPAFAKTGGAQLKKREAAAFLANVHHETGGLVHIVEQDRTNWPTYCDTDKPYGCPAGRAAYHGRGPIQLSWNYNYKAAGDALGIDLLHRPGLVQTDPVVAWKTALWFWMTQSGSGTMTAHSAMVNGAGFGQTIRSINGYVECNGGNPAQVGHRVALYKQFTRSLGVSPGPRLGC